MHISEQSRANVTVIRSNAKHAPHFSHGIVGMDRHHALSRVDSCLGDKCLRHKGITNSRPGTNFLDSSSATPLSTPGRCETMDSDADVASAVRAVWPSVGAGAASDVKTTYSSIGAGVA